jgi:hypothetical protein
MIEPGVIPGKLSVSYCAGSGERFDGVDRGHEDECASR